MPLTVCRCCGGKLEVDSLGRTSNPNICLACEQLLEDDSPTIMAGIAKLKSDPKLDHLLDEPDPKEKPKTRETRKSRHSAK